MTADQIMERVRDYFVARRFVPPEDRETLTATAPLVTGGILDSLGALSLVGFLEDEYGIEIDPDEINVDNLDTLRAIAALVESKQGR